MEKGQIIFTYYCRGCGNLVYPDDTVVVDGQRWHRFSPATNAAIVAGDRCGPCTTGDENESE